jgi:hypothetical protein
LQLHPIDAHSIFTLGSPFCDEMNPVTPRDVGCYTFTEITRWRERRRFSNGLQYLMNCGFNAGNTAKKVKCKDIHFGVYALHASIVHEHQNLLLQLGTYLSPAPAKKTIREKIQVRIDVEESFKFADMVQRPASLKQFMLVPAFLRE